MLAAPALISFMSAGGISASTMKLGIMYLRTQMVAFLFRTLTMTITALLRGTGNARPSMYYNFAVNGVKIIFNFILIPSLGLFGAGCATIIGQIVGLIMAFGFLLSGKYYLHLSFHNFSFDYHILADICRVGIPAMFEQACFRISLIAFSRIVASLGEVSLATHQICDSISSTLLMNGQAFAIAATALIGQSLGKKRPDMAVHYGRKCQTLSILISLVAGVGAVVFGKPLVRMFNDTEPEVANFGVRIMPLLAVLQPLTCYQLVTAGALRGAGDTKSVALIFLVSYAIGRTILTMLVVRVFHGGIVGAWGAMVGDQIIRTLLILFRYNSGKWQSIRLAE